MEGGRATPSQLCHLVIFRKICEVKKKTIILIKLKLDQFLNAPVLANIVYVFRYVYSFRIHRDEPHASSKVVTLDVFVEFAR